MTSIFREKAKSTFSERLFKQFRQEFPKVFEVLKFVFMMLYGALLWLMSFSMVNTIVVRAILQPLIIYVIGVGLTHIPTPIVIILALLPVYVAVPVLLVAFLLTFIH